MKYLEIILFYLASVTLYSQDTLYSVCNNLVLNRTVISNNLQRIDNVNFIKDKDTNTFWSITNKEKLNVYFCNDTIKDIQIYCKTNNEDTIETEVSTSTDNINWSDPIVTKVSSSSFIYPISIFNRSSRISDSAYIFFKIVFNTNNKLLQLSNLTFVPYNSTSVSKFAQSKDYNKLINQCHLWIDVPIEWISEVSIDWKDMPENKDKTEIYVTQNREYIANVTHLGLKCSSELKFNVSEIITCVDEYKLDPVCKLKHFDLLGREILNLENYHGIYLEFNSQNCTSIKGYKY